jgi:hypothetical protein
MKNCVQEYRNYTRRIKNRDFTKTCLNIVVQTRYVSVSGGIEENLSKDSLCVF